MDKKRLHDEDTTNPSSGSKKFRLESNSSLNNDDTIDIKVDFFYICSSLRGKHVLPKAIGLRHRRQSGNNEIKSFFLNPIEFIPKTLDTEFVRQELAIAGYNEDMSQLSFGKRVVGSNVCHDEHQEIVSKLDAILSELFSWIKTRRDETGQKIILNFFNKNSKTFFISLFQRNELETYKQMLFQNVQSFVCEDEVCDLVSLSDELRPNEELASQCHVFVDLVYLTFENEELTRYTQLAHIAAFFQPVDKNDSAKFYFDSEVIPIILENGDRVIRSTARKKLSEASKNWRGNETGSFVSEHDAVAGFCSFLQDCCSCRTNSSISCNVTLVTMSSATLTPILLSKVREHNLEKDFFQHISNVIDLLTVAKKLKFNLPQDGIKNPQSSQVSGGCQKMRTVVRKYLDQLDQFAVEASLIKINKIELKSSTETLKGLFIGGDSIDCRIGQVSRPNWMTNLCLTFRNGDEDDSPCDDIWSKKKVPATSLKIILLANFDKFCLAEICPEPSGNWTHAKYSILNGTEIFNGTANVFNGKYLILTRKEGFRFSGQTLGVCQFVRPSIGRTQCSRPCNSQFNVASDSTICVKPKSTTVIRTRVLDGSDHDVKHCLEANHILKVSEVLIPDLFVINVLVNPHDDFQVTIRNQSDHGIQLSSDQTIFKAVCSFNEKGVSALLSSQCDTIDFFQNWDAPKTSRDELEGRRSKSPSNHQEVEDKQKGGDKNDGLNLNPDLNKSNGHEVFSIDDDDEEEVKKDDDEIEVFAELTHNHGLVGNDVVCDEKVVRKFCEFCTDIRRLEKCPNCPEFVVKLTDIYDEHGFCVAKISYPEEGKEDLLKRKIRWAKFFSSDYSIMCPFITEVVKKELLLVYYVNIAACEESLAGEEIGTCQIIDWNIKRKTSVKCKKKRVLVAGCNAVIPAKTSSEVEISWGLNSRQCEEQGHFQLVVSMSDSRLSCPIHFVPFFDLANISLTNTTTTDVNIVRGQALMTTECVGTTESAKAIVQKKLQTSAKIQVEEEDDEIVVLEEPRENVLFAKGFMYPMSPSVLTPEPESDDDIQEIDVSFNKDCKKSCLTKGVEWSTFCTNCPQYSLLTINANILPTDGSYVTVLCRVLGPLIDDVDECPNCIALFPSTTSNAIFQVVRSIREVLLCGNNAFAYVTISTRSRGILDNRELVSGTLLAFGQKRTKIESVIGDGQCLWPFKLKLDSEDSEHLIVENGESVKIHVSFIVPEAHKFDPVAVEFGFAFEKVGNEDRNFLLQGTTDLVLTFVNKGKTDESCKDDQVPRGRIELKHGAVLGNIRLLSDISSVQLAVSHRTDLPRHPVRFVDTSGRTSYLRPVVASQNVSVLKNTKANVICRVQNDEDRDGEAALRHVLLLDPETEDTPWAFKSRLITANSVESSEKFYVQLHNRLMATNHLRIDDTIACAKIFDGLESNAHYEIFQVVGRIPISVAPGGLFTLHCELVRWSGYSGKTREKFRIHSGRIELVSVFDLYLDKNIDLMFDTVVIETMTNSFRKDVVFFYMMARNNSEDVLRPQFVEVGLARGLVVSE